MKISILGLGYVGCVSAGCLSNNGHYIVGVDIERSKIDLINQGKPTIIEKDIDELIKNGIDKGLLKATTDINSAIMDTDVSIICVGTPSSETGQLNLDYVYRVAEQIGIALKNKNTFHVLAIRSTVQPGTCLNIAKIIERKSKKIKNKDFAIVSNPEFLREGTAVYDYYNPTFTLIGSDCNQALEIMENIYENINAPIYRTKFEVAEIIKYVNNAFHALKITFANEVGNICKGMNIDSHKVMEIFCKDTRLNISPYYLKPGFAYGGSCLPKDLRALVNLAKQMNLESPVLSNIERSNELQKELVLKEIIKLNKKKIGILGLSFKAGTDDLRESPIIDVIERLIGKGYKVKICDRNVELSRLTGSNKSYIQSKLPHLSLLLTNLQTLINDSEVIVIANKEEEYKDIFTCIEKPDFYKIDGVVNEIKFKNKIAYDLVRIAEEASFEGQYNGICW